MGDRVNAREDSCIVAGPREALEPDRPITPNPDLEGSDSANGAVEPDREDSRGLIDGVEGSSSRTLPYASLRGGCREGAAVASRQAGLSLPDIEYDDDRGVYTVNGERAVRVSRVAKIGADVWGAASTWGWRIGRDGALEVLRRHPEMSDEDVDAEMGRLGLTPWATRNQAADRGTDVHDILEALAQDGTVPDLDALDGERRGHALSLLRWYRRFRPSFVATEVMVASAEHGFAGRYDMRALFDRERLLDALPERAVAALVRPELLGLGDLKTSKRVYPEQHFAQLDGYEEASCECGYPASDFRFVVRTRPDGECAEMVVSWAERGTFLAYLAAAKAIDRIKWLDPKAVAKRQREAERHAQEVVVLQALEDHGPTTSGKLVLPLRPMQAKVISRVLQRLKGQGRVECSGRTWSVRHEAS